MDVEDIKLPEGTESRTRSPALSPSIRVFVNDHASEAVIRQSLGALGYEAQFAPGTVKTAASVLAKERSPKLLIVDVSGVEDPVRGMRALAEVSEPDISVLVIGDRNDIILYRDLKGTGIAEYLLKPLLRDLLTRTCKNILAPEEASASRRTGKLIFILGVRGGVGATTIAANSAWHLAETRRRPTMLLDLDLQAGDTALQFDTTPTDGLRDALEHPERVDKLYLERGVRHVSERLDLFASLESLGAREAVSEEAILSLIEKLLPRYRFVVVDIPPALAARSFNILSLPGTRVLVANPNLAGARDFARWSEVIGSNTPDRSTLYLLNQANRRGALSIQEFARASGRNPDIVIPDDRELVAAATLGIKAMQKCASFKHGLEPLLHELTGEAFEKPRPLFWGLFR